MSAISGVGRAVHHSSLQKSTGKPSAGDSTSLTASILSGSVTGSIPALAGASSQPHVSTSVLKQVEQAVTKALQSSKPTDDPRKVVQNVIAGVLKKNAGHLTAPAADADADTTDSDGTERTFNQTLQAYGITSQQFRAQLLTALHGSTTGSTGSGASNLSSFPPGVMLDTAA